MGWTVYFRRKPFANHQWDAFAAQCRKIVDQSGVALSKAAGKKTFAACFDSPPQVDAKAVCFGGGSPEESCETFYLPRKTSDSFEFCKTRRLPYTAPVIACVMAASHHLGFQSSCDGWDEEVRNGAKLFLKTLDEKSATGQSWKGAVRRHLGEAVPEGVPD